MWQSSNVSDAQDVETGPHIHLLESSQAHELEIPSPPKVHLCFLLRSSRTMTAELKTSPPPKKDTHPHHLRFLRHELSHITRHMTS